jgi:chromosome segregation ATPase
MSDASKDIILEYKDQVRLLREEVAELQDAGKTKDAANKRCLQKLENTNEDLSRANKELQELKDKFKELKTKE